MFNKFGSKEASSATETRKPIDTSAVPSAEKPPVQPKPPKPKPNLSVIGKSVELKGELVAGEDLLIQGKLEGSVRNKSQNLVVGKDGSLKADINGRCVVVQGTVSGDIHGDESVVVESSARVQGNISSSSIGVEKGARFKGTIDSFGDGKPPKDGSLSDEAVDKILDEA